MYYGVGAMPISASLCSFCRSLIENAYDSTTNGRKHIPAMSRTRKEIHISSDQGCPLCTWSRMEFERMSAEPNVLSDLSSSAPQRLDDVFEVTIADVTLRGLYKSKDEGVERHTGTMDIDVDFLNPECNPALVSVILTTEDSILDSALKSACSDTTLTQIPGSSSSQTTPMNRYTSTDSEKCFNQAREWLDTCSASHCQCKATKSPSRTRPSRLIHLSSQPQGSIHARIREWSGDQVPENATYTTMSHRWMSGDRQRLTRANLKQFHDHIPTEQLKASIQDAMKVTLRLGMEYIWIDSLCIVQDDDGDKAGEISKMHAIYGDTVCTIVASWAANLDDRCFTTRPEARAARYSIRLDLGGHLPQEHCLTRSWSDGFIDVQSSDLNERGWIFQEIFLSPRLLYYGHSQIFWECAELQASEMHPNGAPDGSRQENLVRRLRREIESLDPGPGRRRLHEVWAEIVEHYCFRKMTFEQDRLDGISGVATFVKTFHGDEYLHGHWKTSLPHSLLWAAAKDGSRELAHRQFRRLDIAPSWSWGSLSCRYLSFITASNADVPLLRSVLNTFADHRKIYAINQDEEVWTQLADVVDCASEDATEAPPKSADFSPSTHTVMRLNGHLRKIVSNVDRYLEPDFGFLIRFEHPTETVVIYPDFIPEFEEICQQQPNPLRLLPILAPLRSPNVHGLLLARNSIDSSLPVYTRVGFYTAVMGTTDPLAQPTTMARPGEDSQGMRCKRLWMRKFETWAKEDFWLC